MTAIYDFLTEAMRDRFGGSVTRLADACDVSVALASRWVHEDERKRMVPSPNSCEKIATGLNVDADYVLEMAGHRQPRGAPEPRPSKLDAFLALVEAAFHAYSDHEWAVREEVGRALFSVPPTADKRHHNGRFEAPRPNPKASSKQDDSSPDSSLTDWYPRKQPALSLAVPAL